MPQTLDHLEDNIRRVIADIRPQMLEKVIENWTPRLDYIRSSRGRPSKPDCRQAPTLCKIQLGSPKPDFAGGPKCSPLRHYLYLRQRLNCECQWVTLRIYKRTIDDEAHDYELSSSNQNETSANPPILKFPHGANIKEICFSVDLTCLSLSIRRI
ncbi:hypothetical protein TNCV_4988101 [Trichonephila clavipes]|nr:hypothetical protein TNCV_4988101 [Trichonephila clavipes]